MSETTFGGASKVGQSVLGPWEKRFVARYVPLVPRWLETYHLTSLTVVWSALVILLSWVAREQGNLNWLWLVSLVILLQYATDLFDGAVGRHRNTGLIKWGFFMDHFLDFIFQGAIVIGYYLISPAGLELYFFGILLLSGGFMVNSFLSFASTNEFEIYFFGIGPTEIRFLVIVMNGLIVMVGTAWWPVTVPCFFYAFLAGLAFLCWRTQRRLWEHDMKAKEGAAAAAS